MPNALESCFKKTRRLFADFLTAASERPGWWYVVKHDDADPESLASLCGLTDDELEEMLVAANLARKGKSGAEFSFLRANFILFLSEYSIPNAETDKCRIPSLHPTQNFVSVRVGQVSGAQNARDLFKQEERRVPRILRSEFQRSFRNGFDSLFPKDKDEFETSEESVASPPSIYEDVVVQLDAYIEEVMPSLHQTPLQEYTTVRDFLAPFLIKPSMPLDEAPNWEQLTTSLLETAQKIREERSVGLQKLREEIGATVIGKEVSLAKYPTLAYYGIDLTTDFHIKSILREIVKLNDEVVPDLLKLPHGNCRETVLVQIPRSSRLDLFRRNNTRTRWIERVLDAAIPEESPDGDSIGPIPEDVEQVEDNERGTTKNDSARWLLTALGKLYPDEFVMAADNVGMPIHGNRMSPEDCQAMFEEGNISVTAQRVLRKHLRIHTHTRLLASESSIRKLGDEDPVPPKHGTTTFEGKTVDFWNKDLDKVLESHLVNYFADAEAVRVHS
jgi:hypothetical protein